MKIVPDQFVLDISTIFKNAMDFNTSGSALFMDAQVPLGDTHRYN
jgi:hypothetical protein